MAAGRSSSSGEGDPIANLLSAEQRSAAQLQHRGLFLLWLLLPGGQPGPVDTWYTPEARYAFGRVSEVGNFLGQRRGRVLCVEIPQGRHPADRDWLAALPELRQHLAEAGILAENAALGGVVQRFLPRVYPLYRRGWLPRWQAALRQVGEGGRVWPVGRQGLWLHCNLDHAMASAEHAAEEIVRGADSAAWAQGPALRWGEVRVRD